ncbi:MAG: zf-TFIIB domain-containing protein [Pseudomonadota bacterium]
MKCPVDGETLVVSERSGVEIDYCPQCRGVWLDRGELDKIIDRSGSFAARDDELDEGDYGHSSGRRRKKNKFGGFLDDIFDF